MGVQTAHILLIFRTYEVMRRSVSISYVDMSTFRKRPMTVKIFRKACAMRRQEPPSLSNISQPLFLIGRNHQGQWVVRNQCGSRGGLFADRANALKFAMFESGHKLRAVIMVPGVFELDTSGKPNPVRYCQSD
jgi:hypothetical protein